MLGHKATRAARMVFGAALVYLLLDVPVQLTGFLGYGSYIGIKNFLPAVLGLLMGPYGVAGACAGCLTGVAILRTAPAHAAFECAAIVLTGFGMWLSWHAVSKTHKIHFKRAVHYALFLALAAAFAAACGVLSGLFLPESAMAEVFVAYTVTSLLIGAPILILANGIFWVQAVLPAWCHVSADLESVIDGAADSIGRFNDALEESALRRGISRKRLFEMQNAVEEVALRVLATLPEARLTLRFDYDDTASFRFSYPGERYDPLRIGRDEDELDLMGVRLIRHRALRASYAYTGGTNHVHIVV